MKLIATKCLLVAAALLAACGAAHADAKTKAVAAVAEEVLARFGSKAGKSLPALIEKIESYVARYGEDALLAVRRVGPDAFALADEAGVNGARAMRVMATYGEEGVTNVLRRPKALEQFVRYGDDAAKVLVKHPAVAESLVERGGPSAVQALEAVTTRNGRRIAMLMDGELGQLPRSTELLHVIGKFGDRAAAFIWENKGSLAIGTVLTAFLVDPEAFINGTKDLAAVAGEAAARPLAEGVARGTNWTPVVLLALAAVIGFGLLLAAKWGLFTPAVADKLAATTRVPAASVAHEANGNQGA